MTKISFLLLFFISVNATFAQRFDFGIEFTLPFISPSVVNTKYNYLTDDPVSFDFAKIKHKTQIQPAFNFSGQYFAQISYRMIGLRLTISPMTIINVKHKVYFPDFVNGESPYNSAILRMGGSSSLSLRYSLKTIGNKKLTFILGGFIFRDYFFLGDSEAIFSDSNVDVGELYKYLLWDDHKIVYGPHFGIEFSWLDKYRVNKKYTIMYNHFNKIGFGGFKQGTISVIVGLPTIKIFNSLKRQKVFLES